MKSDEELFRTRKNRQIGREKKCYPQILKNAKSHANLLRRSYEYFLLASR